MVGAIGLTPRARTVIELAVDTARRVHHSSIGTEHLLLGLIVEGEGIAVGVLESLGISREEVWSRTFERMGVLPEQRPTPQRSLAFHGVSHRAPPGGTRTARPGDRFDKFTERARRVLQYAPEEAQRLDHNAIRPEHLLLGLVREGEGVAAKVLGELGVQLDGLRSAVEDALGRGDATSEPASGAAALGLTDEAKRAIELSVDEARRLQHHFIGTEHLLLGLAREGGSKRVLESLGVGLDAVRARVAAIVSQSRTYGQPWTGSAAYGQPVSASAGVPDASFTPGAQRALDEARLSARWFRHPSLGSDDLLLGLLREGDGHAAQALGAVGITLGQASAALEGQRAEPPAAGPSVGPRREPAPSPGVQAALERARQEAGLLGAGQVDTAHLLLGLLALDEDEPSHALLRRLGTSPADVHAALQRLLGQG
jgi:ATP-dependent Clp protease ATP-binding subunit ClpA